jgi:uroporphyrinogen-III decarboxylase
MTAEQKREAIRAAWLRANDDRVPFFVDAGEAVRATRALLSDSAQDLARQEAILAAAAGIDDDSLPSLKPNLGIGVMATAFGCPHVLDEETDPWVKPIITDANPEAALSLALPDPLRDGMLPLALERIEYFRAHGRYPLRCVNLPSPLLTASLVWEYGSFLAALLERPREAHALLERVTAATLAFLRVERERIGALFGWTHEAVWIPPDVALRLSDDVAAVLPAHLYREFGVRYNNAFAGEVGGLVIHSCGDVSRALPAMMETEKLVGIDIVAPQNDLDTVHRTVAGRAALCLRYCDWDFPGGAPASLLEYGMRLVERFGARGTLLWTRTPTLGEAEELARAMRRTLAG